MYRAKNHWLYDIQFTYLGQKSLNQILVDDVSDRWLFAWGYF